MSFFRQNFNRWLLLGLAFSGQMGRLSKCNFLQSILIGFIVVNVYNFKTTSTSSLERKKSHLHLFQNDHSESLLNIAFFSAK
jgi:hypothetical protein